MKISCLDIYDRIAILEAQLVRGNDPLIYEKGITEPISLACIEGNNDSRTATWDDIDNDLDIHDVDGNRYEITRCGKYTLRGRELPLALGVLKALSANHQIDNHPQGIHIKDSMLKEEPPLLIGEPDIEDLFQVGMKYPVPHKVFKDIEDIFYKEVVPIMEAEWPLMMELHVNLIAGMPTILLKGTYSPMEKRYINIMGDLEHGCIEIVNT